MTTKVTVSVPETANWMATVALIDAPYAVPPGPVTPCITSGHLVMPGEARDFYVTDTRSLLIGEKKL